MNCRRTTFVFALLFALATGSVSRAGLLGYWSADTTGGTGTSLPNDQGNSGLDGMLFGGAAYSADAAGHTGQAGDYAIEFLGTDADYASWPATGATLESATITAWVKGRQTGDWAGIVQSRDTDQPIGIGYAGGTGRLGYTWNDNNSSSWGFANGLADGSKIMIPADEWTFVALTITPDDATLYVGPQGGLLQSETNAIPHLSQLNDHEWRLAEDDCCGGGRNFAGLMDDVAIFDGALSPELIGALHSGALTPLTVPEPSGFFACLLGSILMLRRRK